MFLRQHHFGCRSQSLGTAPLAAVTSPRHSSFQSLSAADPSTRSIAGERLSRQKGRLNDLSAPYTTYRQGSTGYLVNVELSRSHIEQRRQNHVFANYRRESHIPGRPKTATRVLSASLRSEPQDCRDSPFAPLQRSRRDVWKTRHGTQSYGSI